MKPANLNQLSENELLSILGQPEKTHVRTESGEGLLQSSPRYLVIPADTSRLSEEYLTVKICVIDFGESFPILSSPADLGIPENHLPPEILLDQENAVSKACDILALGCTLFEIREQLAFFYMIFDKDELLGEIVRLFGKLPKEWWEKWEAREHFLDEEGTWLQRGDDEE